MENKVEVVDEGYLLFFFFFSEMLPTPEVTVWSSVTA